MSLPISIGSHFGDAVPSRTQPPPPPVPATLSDTGLRADQASELMLKTLIGGELSGSHLADRLCLAYSIIESLLEHARVEKLIEVKGSAGAGSAGYRFALTDLGRE